MDEPGGVEEVEQPSSSTSSLSPVAHHHHHLRLRNPIRIVLITPRTRSHGSPPAGPAARLLTAPGRMGAAVPPSVSGTCRSSQWRRKVTAGKSTTASCETTTMQPKVFNPRTPSWSHVVLARTDALDKRFSNGGMCTTSGTSFPSRSTYGNFEVLRQCSTSV